MREKTEVMAGRFTKREVKIIERLARSQKVTVSNYVRSAVMTAAVFDGDLEAMRVVGGYAVQRLAEAGARMMKEGELQLESA